MFKYLFICLTSGENVSKKIRRGMEEKGWEWQGVLRGGEASCFSPEPSTGETQPGLPRVPFSIPIMLVVLGN